MTTITAQDLYDAREATGCISGADLHDVFRALCYGEPSPAGRTVIRMDALQALAETMPDAKAIMEALAPHHPSVVH